MPPYQRAGQVPPKRHTQFRQPSGALYNEELISAGGFAGASSLLNHVNLPTAVKATKSQPPLLLQDSDPEIFRHHRLQTGEVSKSGDFLSSRTPLFFNDDVVISLATPDEVTDGFYRNGTGDELVFVHEGSGVLQSAFGSLSYQANDFVHIPRGITVQWVPEQGQERLLVVESATDIRPPSRYLSASGQMLECSPYCERDLKSPALSPPIDERGSFEVRVKTSQQVTSCYLEYHPFDLVGWDGCYYPFAMSILDFEPIVQRIHTMPNVHQIFATHGGAICCFVPRKADYHPLALPAAPNHSSVDCDEVLYFVSGVSMGRSSEKPGSTTLHPKGLPHGPKPGRYEASIGVKEHTMVAIMIDTFRSLNVADSAMSCDEGSYPFTWIEER